MLLKYREPDFWKSFHKRHWVPRVPGVLRQPFQEFPFSEETLLRSLKTFEAGLRGGDHRITCLVSVGGKETPPRRPLRELFREDSRTMGELEAACGRVFSKKHFGLMVSHLHAVDPAIWSGLTSFLRDGAPWIDPLPRAFVDFFYGNYTSSFTGVHKDTQEIFAFVVRGEKRILAWPFDYFLSKVKGLGPGDRFFNKRLSVDPAKYRKDAVVLDARAGDVLYWPSDHWHVAEARPGHFSSLLSLGVVRPEIVPPPPKVAPPADARRLRWKTSFGFELGGPMSRDVVPAPVTVVKNPESLLLWNVDAGRRRLVVAANGHSASLAHSPRLVTLLERLARGESLTASADTTRATLSETYWNPRCELKTRRVSSPQGSRAALVQWLLRVYAVRTVKTLVAALLVLTSTSALAGSAKDTIETFYRGYLGGKGKKPKLEYSKSLNKLAAENKKVCLEKAGSDLCGWGGENGDRYLNAQEYDPHLTYENSGAVVTETKPGNVTIKLNVYPSQKDAGKYYDREIVYKMLEENGKWVVDDILYKDVSTRKLMQEETATYSKAKK